MKLWQKKQQQVPNRRTTPPSREGRASADSLQNRYAFRRNRTLTGSLSSDVSSSNEQRAELRSPRVEVHHLRRHRRRLFLVFVAVAAIVAGLAWLLYYSIAGVIIVVDASVPPVDTSMYEKKVQSYLNAHPFERNRTTLNTTQLAEYLQANDAPEVERVSVNARPSGVGVSTIMLTMRKPVVSWQTGSSQLYVDSSGAAFARNYYAAPSVQVVDQTGIQAVNNQVLASDRFLGFIGRSIGRLETQGFTVTKVVLPTNTTRQLLVSIDGLSYSIKFSVDRPAGVQAEDAARAIRFVQSHAIQVSEYMDVRVSGKAYYK